MNKPYAELIHTNRASKCRLCNNEVRQGQRAVILRNIHVSPKIVDLFFHDTCWPVFIEVTYEKDGK